ncbi:hypothetical protein BAE44_0012189 [Dichanthelium oligosanthes]|uniref:Non-classical arabinogalactan protein 30 n=1 Tax=Dichanthelium oligosanthes TaxID=888268 RepID=A0A1E5VNT3_9POAL|nr:hypothetical protein BAE44_0012189 [Dichanthelium oligosanthes]
MGIHRVHQRPPISVHVRRRAANARDCVPGCLLSRGEAMGLPQPPPDLNFTIAVEGVVWCKTCRYAGYVRSMDASPLPNAPALLRCRRSDGQALSVWNTTDADGYFLIQADWQSAPFKSRDCKVYVPWPPARGCAVAVKPAARKGAPLKFRRFVPLSDELQARYSAGNFTFAPKDPAKVPGTSMEDLAKSQLMNARVMYLVMAPFLTRSLLGWLALVMIFTVACLPSRGSAMGMPRPQPNLNFTIGVEGVVWCKGCRYRGYVQSRDASPLPNAWALLRCRHGHRALSVWNATNAHGYFLIQTGAQAAPFTSKNCKVYVPRSPARGCRVAVSPARKRGSPLRFRRFVTLADGLQGRYSAGTFTFAPQDRSKC